VQGHSITEKILIRDSLKEKASLRAEVHQMLSSLAFPAPTQRIKIAEASQLNRLDLSMDAYNLQVLSQSLLCTDKATTSIATQIVHSRSHY